MRQCLGEPETRVEDDAFGTDTRCCARRHPLFKIARYIGGHILVMRVVLHVPRLAAHVHQAHRQPGICSGIEGAIALQRTHVVDQASTEASRLTHDGRR
ncbi:hypothetical protein D3C79_861480 [compost metagenome]